MKTDGKVVISTKLDNSGLTKGLSSLKSAFSGLGKIIGSTFAVRTLINFGKEAIELASDLEEVQNVVQVAFGSMSSEVDKFAKNAMKQFGISELNAKQYMGTFGAMSKAFGNSVSEAYEQAKILTSLTGDVASFYNLTTDEAFTKLKGVYTGETEGLKSLGVVMTQTALDEFALANGFGKTTKAMSEQERVALRLAFVQNALNSASGDFARTSDSWANQTKVLSLQFDNLKTAIGTGLIQALTPAIKMLNRLMEALVNIANKFSEITAKLFGKQVLPTEQAVSGVESLTEAENELAEATNKATEASKRSLAGFDKLNKLGDDKESASSATAGGMSGSLGSITMDTSQAEDSAEQLTDKLTELEKALEELKKISFDNLKKSFEELKEPVKELGGKIWDGLKWAYYNILVPLAKWTIEEALPASIDVLTGTFKVFNSVLDALKPLAKWVWERFLQPLAKWSGGKFVDALNWIAKKLDKISDWINKNQSKLEDLVIIIGSFVAAFTAYKLALLAVEAKAKLFAATQAVVNAVMNANPAMYVVAGIGALIAVIALCIKHWDDIKLAAINAWDVIVEKWNNAKTWFKEKVTDPISNTFTNLWSNLRESASNAWNTIKTSFTDIGQKIGDAVGSAFKKAVNAVLATIERFANTPINAINKLLDVINTVPGINIGKLNTFSLPRLAQGAVIPANREFLAVLGDQKNGRNLEGPESLFRQIVREESGGNRNGQPIVVQIMLNGKVIGEETIEYINGIIRKTGKTPIRQGG